MNHRPHNLVKRLASICILAILAFQVVFLPSVAQAATPDNIVQYQGRLLNANGVPVSAASVNVIFEFYDDQVGGTCLWSNSSSTCASSVARTVLLTDGLFSEPLGTTTIASPYAAIPETVFGDYSEVYLGVTINGETLTPRKRVLTSPYAINSSLLDGLDTTTTGATDSAIPAFDANGALVVTGNPGGSGVGQGSLYINPAAVDSAANDTIFGVADGGTELFRIDKEGDVFIGGIALNATSGTAGASLIGVDSGLFTQSAETDVQAVLLDFDTVLNGLAAGTSKWTDSGTFTYLTGTSDDLVLGSTAVATASLFFDESAGVLALGTDSSLNGGLTLYSSGGTDVLLAADSSGNLDVTAALLDLTGDIRVDGGDFTSVSTTFNFLDAAASSSNIDIGGVTTNLANTINIATNGTSADTINIGNSNASTAVALTGGDDWSIAANGNVTTLGYLEANAGLSLPTQGEIFSSDTSFDFLDATGASQTIDIGGVTANIANTINIATNSDTGDAITIGNGAGGTTIGIQAGNAWGIDTSGNFAGQTASYTSAVPLAYAIDASDADFIAGITVGNNNIVGGTGEINFTNFDVAATTGSITTGGDLALNGGDLTTSAGTFNILDQAAVNTINIGGVIEDAGNVINIATNISTSDVISIGNANIGTTMLLRGGDDWNIQTSGDASFESVTVADSSGLLLNPYGAGAGETSAIYFFELTGGNAVGFKAPDSITGDTTWTLPSGDGGAGEVLTTNGSGVLSWDSLSIASDSLDFTEFADNMTLDANLTVTAANNTVWNLTSSGDFEIHDNGSQVFSIDDNGIAIFSDDIDINQDIGADIENIDIDVSHSQNFSVNYFDISATNTAASNTGTNYFISLANLDDGGSTGTSDAFIGIVNYDVNESIDYGILMAGTGGYGTALDISDTSITTGINLGANDIVGTSAVINFSNFDVSSTGDISAGGSLTFNGSAGEDFTFQRVLTDATTDTGMTLAVTASDTTSGTLYQHGLVISNQPSTEALDSALFITSADLDDAIGRGIWLGPSADFNIGLDLSETGIVTGIDLGANDIIGTTAVIDFNNFDVDADGDVTMNALSVLGDLDITQTLSASGTENVTFTINQTADSTGSPINIDYTNTQPTGAGVTYVLNVMNSNEAGATGSPDALVALRHLDTDETLADAITVISSGGVITTAFSASDSEIVNALEIGNNTILGSAGVIDFTSFDVDSGGNVTATDFICTDCLDFDSLETQLDLDESTDIAFGTRQLNMELDSTGNFIVAMTGTGDFIVQDGGTPFATFNSGSTIDLNSNSGGVDFLDIDGGTITTATALDLTVNGLLSGAGLRVSSTSTGITSGDLSHLSHTATYSSTGTVTGSGIDLNRVITNNSGGLLTVSGDLLSVASNNANTSGTLTDTASLGSFSQSNTGATGDVIEILNNGTGNALFIDANGDTGTTVSDTLGGALHISNTGNSDYGLTVYSNDSTSTSSLAYIFADSTGFDDIALEVRQDANATTGAHGILVTQASLGATSGAALGRHALVLDTNQLGNVSDEFFVMRSDADGTPDIEFRFEADGDAFADGTWTGGGADFAEWMISSDVSLGGNDVVCRDESTLNGVKECAPGETSIIGAISTNPGFIGNYQESFDYGIPANYRLVGLIGQIDVSASAADGAIAVGDLVTTSSSVAGAVGKAGGPSRVLGYALEPLVAGSGVIKVMVQPTWSAEGTITSDGSAIVMRETFALASLATANSSANYGSELLSFRGSAWNGSSAQSVAMGLETMVDSVSAYRLAVTNTAGTEVASINQSGDLSLAGRFYPSDSGSMQNSAYIYYDSTGLGYMRTNAAGWSTGSYDFAEMFPSPDALVPGEVVVFGTGREQMTRSTGKKYDDRIAGIVSTRPGFLAGEWRDGEYPVALSGRVPTYVTSENGAIKVGDPLTTSSKPGYAMKATQAGPIVGYAMEDHSSGDGSIIVFVRASYYDGATTNVAPAADTAISGLSSSTVATLDITGTLNMNGGSIFSVGSIQGAGGTWSISGNGDIETEGRLVQLVRSYQNEDVETYAATSREMTIQLSGTATLQNGTAVISLESVDPKFNDIISSEVPYRVFVTPNGATGQISVTNREQASFVIRDTSGADGVLVDWLVIGTHKDYVPSGTSVIVEPELPEVPPDNLPSEEVIEEEVINPDEEPVEPPAEEVVEEEVVIEPEVTEDIIVEDPIEEIVPPVEEVVGGGEELIDEVAEVTP